MKKLPYRKNVVGIVKENDKFLLVQLNEWPDDLWKFPQGGVNKNEKELDALSREIFEELGTTNFLTICKFPYTHQYDWDSLTIKRSGHKWRGQKQTFYLIFANDINVNHKEIKKYCWLSKEEVLKRIDNKHPIFKGYKKVIEKCLKNL
jgi:putative (di)nucleoside polyphosphate hydrolase